MIKKLLKKYKYPPEGREDALKTVMEQCELRADNQDMGDTETKGRVVDYAEMLQKQQGSEYVKKAAESEEQYDIHDNRRE